MDLNALIRADSELFLIDACSVNASGQIIGIAVDLKGDAHGYLATPGSGAGNAWAGAATGVDATRFHYARTMLQQSLKRPSRH